jgi:hypothetical protein
MVARKVRRIVTVAVIEVFVEGRVKSQEREIHLRDSATFERIYHAPRGLSFHRLTNSQAKYAAQYVLMKGCLHGATGE